MLSRLKIILVALFAIIVTIHSYERHVTIEQCPGSEVPQIRQQVQNHEVSLIFYYTRWSADSLAALEVYNDVAQYYSDKVYFASIDCWHLSCNCSRTLNTPLGSGLPHKWPTLVAYYGRRGQLQILYHGLWSFKDIQQFVNNLLYPLERLLFVEDLPQMRKVSDVVIVGLFEDADCAEYKQYLIASLKWLENDPLRTYRYTVAFNASATETKDVTKEIQIPNILFVGPASTRIFRSSRNQIWNASNILMWLHKELKKELNHMHGYETPITVAQKVTQNPVLTVFVNDMQKFFTYMEPHIDTEMSYTALAKKCSKGQKYTQTDDNLRPLKDANIINNINIYSDHSRCHYNISILFRNLAEYYEIDNYIKLLVSNLAYPFKEEQYIAKSNTERLLETHHLNKCLNSDITSSSTLQIGIVKYAQILVEADLIFSNSNRSMSVVMLETEQYRDYLENMDVRVQQRSMATCVIIDKDQESIFLMEELFDIANLKAFVHRFNTHNLMPYFKSEKLNVQMPSSFSSADSFAVKKLNRQMFLNYLHFVNNQTLVVLIHSDECALCGTLQQTFIQLAAAFRHFSSELQFLRINAFRNNLPWQFDMPTLPALLVFPKYHYGETRLFPSHLKPDVRSVLAFILNQLSPQDQIKTTVTYCQSPALSSEHSQSCWQFAKSLLMQHIGKHLHYWQLFETERNTIFEHLRAFKDMSLDIQRNLRL